MKLLVHPSAESELADAARWYDAHTPGVGTDLLAEANGAIALILDAPTRAPSLGSGQEFRSVALSRFPYSVIYAVRADEIFVLAFAHHRRAPGYWKRRSR